MSDKEIDVQDDIVDLLNKGLPLPEIEDIIEETHGSRYRVMVVEVLNESK